jgi:hypothetical protein
MTKTGKKIISNKDKPLCIIGSGFGWEKCPFGNEDWEYWTLNNMHKVDDIDHYTQWFQLHQPGSGEGHVDDPEHRKFLKSWQKGVWIQKEEYAEVLGIAYPMVYPFDAAVDLMCPRNPDGTPYPYFTNSIDYMFCLAILQEYNPIYLHGVEFISLVDDEYFKMRQSVEYYVGKAQGMGYDVIVQDYSALLKARYIYAWEVYKEDPIEQMVSQNLAKLKGQQAIVEDSVKTIERKRFTQDGAIQALEQVLHYIKLKDKGAQM